MSLLALLESLGGRLGILEIAQGQTPQSQPKIQTRVVTLAELATEIKSDEVRALAQHPAELSIPLEKIFETGGIKPKEHSWTVEKLKEVLRSGPFQNQPKDVTQKKILELLRAENVSPEDIVKDAMARDKVLDSFEVYARKKVEERRTALERRAVEITESIGKLEAERSDLDRKRKDDEERWADWRRQKKAQEQDMAWAVSHLIDRLVISISDE